MDNGDIIPNQTPQPEVPQAEPARSPNEPQNVTMAPETASTNIPNIDPAVLMPGFKSGRNSKITAVIAGGIVAIVMIIGLSIFLTALNKQTSQTETKPETASKEDKKDNSYLTENEKQTLVKKVLNEVKEAATDIDETTAPTETSDVIETTYSVQDVYDSDNPLYFASGAKVPTFVNKSFGFVINAPDQPELIVQMAKNAEAKLKKLGFTPYKDAGEDTTGAYGWQNSEDKIVCTPLRDNITTLSLSCGHTSWIPVEKVALVNSLASAYIEKEGKTPAYINASIDEIKNSPYQPYQKIIATLPDTAGLFYRPSQDSGWVFFMEAQDNIPCSEFYSDSGARHAFQGDTCLDSEGKKSKVSESNIKGD